MGPISYIAAGSTLGLMLMTGLYLDKRDDLASQVERCNAQKLESIAVAEKITRESMQVAHDREIVNLARQAADAENARATAEAGRSSALEGTAEREARIIQLMMEASVDEIPDSSECLNVFVPKYALDWVQLPAGDCGETSAGGSAGADEVCVNPRRINGRSSVAEDFSAITYSDAMIIWGRDRDSIEILNARLRAIRELSGSENGQ